jgi:hypothetical protein
MKNLVDPCGCVVEYLHRDPASRRRRRKGKSQIWDSKIWSRAPRDLDPRKTRLTRASSIHKRQTRPLVREGAPQKQDRNCQRVINIWSWALHRARHQDLLADRQSQCDFDFDFLRIFSIPCGGGVEYFHSSRVIVGGDERKTRIWDSKIWSRVPRDSYPKMTALSRASSNCKLQNRPSLERAPQNNKPVTVWQ